MPKSNGPNVDSKQRNQSSWNIHVFAFEIVTILVVANNRNQSSYFFSLNHRTSIESRVYISRKIYTYKSVILNLVTGDWIYYCIILMIIIRPRAPMFYILLIQRAQGKLNISFRYYVTKTAPTILSDAFFSSSRHWFYPFWDIVFSGNSPPSLIFVAEQRYYNICIHVLWPETSSSRRPLIMLYW